jgi:hypothetical protein
VKKVNPDIGSSVLAGMFLRRSRSFATFIRIVGTDDVPLPN